MNNLSICYDSNDYIIKCNGTFKIHKNTLQYSIHIATVVHCSKEYYILQINQHLQGVLFEENTTGKLQLNQKITVQVITNALINKRIQLSMFIIFYGIYGKLVLNKNSGIRAHEDFIPQLRNVLSEYTNYSYYLYDICDINAAIIELQVWLKTMRTYDPIWSFIYQHKLHMNCNQISVKVNIPDELVKYCKVKNIKINYVTSNVYKLSCANVIYDKTELGHCFDVNRCGSKSSNEDINLKALQYILSTPNMSGNVVIDLLPQTDYTNFNSILQSKVQLMPLKIRTYLLTEIGMLIIAIQNI